jgi:hypothetical protein
MKRDTLEYRMMVEHNRLKVPNAKLLTGSLSGKYPVVLDDGKTTIFIDDQSKEAEARERYSLHMNKKQLIFEKKSKT